MLKLSNISFFILILICQSKCLFYKYIFLCPELDYNFLYVYELFWDIT